ncbi:MAG TPA: ATP-binding protein, partial [Dehalococcoidia bacterium]|nr:ATP-binding protein [Dehalococcoidia bacterium]
MSGAVETGYPADPSERSPFVGRGAELQQLHAAWEKAVRGERQIVLVSGEPGIGKTRLARELAHEVHEAGATVLHGRCHEEALVPYEPFVEALAPVVADRARIEAWAGATAGELGRLFPALGEPPSLAGGNGARH